MFSKISVNTMCLSGALLFFTLPARTQVAFDISRTPFSYRGSYMAIHKLTSLLNASAPNERDGVILRNVAGRRWFGEFLRLEILENGKIVEPVITASPAQLTLTTSGGSVRLCFEDRNVLRIRGRGISLRIEPSGKTHAVWIGKNLRLTTGEPNGSFWMISRLAGVWQQAGMNADSTKPNEFSTLNIEFTPGRDGSYETAIEQFTSEWEQRDYPTPFDTCVARTNTSFEEWLRKMPNVPATYRAARNLACYINWSCLVQPRRQMKREGMLMSKNWMNQIWSWDHCFNAIAMAPAYPDVAWDQYACVFDHEGPLGSLPDSFDDEKELWGILKTPIHGWALQRIMEHSSLPDTAQIRSIYPLLARWTDFWFRYRDPDHNGLPQYNHSYESFDDTPPFDVGLPVEGPELASFLVLQMDVLSTMATSLHKPAEAASWHTRADTLTSRLIRYLWNGEKFISINTVTGKWNKEGDSFLSYVPLILGKRLRKDIRDKLIAGLKKQNGLLTPYGMATESVSSPYFDTNSYTRGSIWAPVNYILVDALNRCGEKEFAGKIASAYCNLLAKNGFAERADALTGASKSDPEYTWTSSVFMILTSQFVTPTK